VWKRDYEVEEGVPIQVCATAAVESRHCKLCPILTAWYLVGLDQKVVSMTIVARSRVHKTTSIENEQTSEVCYLDASGRRLTSPLRS